MNVTNKKINSTKIMDSSVLFEGQKIIKILHDSVIYTLRITKDNKLILTK